MMKLTIFALACILGATLVRSEFNKEEVIKEFMAKAEICVGETGAQASDIDDMVKHLPAASKEAKCLRACLMKKCHVMTDDGKFSRDGALEKAKFFTNEDPAKMKIAEEIIDICIAAQTATDPCEAAEEYGKCFKDQLTTRGIAME